MVRRPFDSSSAPSFPLHVCVCRMRRFSCISLCFRRLGRATSARTARWRVRVFKKASGYLVLAFHVPASTSVQYIVPSRSSAGQSLIATRAWLACRASLHEGGYDYATFLRWRSRALTDGAPAFFRADPDAALQPSREVLGRPLYHACLFIAGAWAMMTVAIDARRSKKFYCQGWAKRLSLSSHAFCARRPRDRLR